MCQKAFAAPFGALVFVEHHEWTRGAPKHFQSSNKVRRGFCGECGTPLTYEWEGGLDLAICAFDDPAAISPKLQLDVAARLPWCEGLMNLPTRNVEQQAKADAYMADIISRQHPDHDTTDWKPRS
jgi:hypothetical protein